METFIFWLVVKKVISPLAFKGLRIFSFCIMPWKDESEPTIKLCMGRQVDDGSKSSPQYRILDTIDGEPMEFEWNIFIGFTSLQLVREVQEFLSKLSAEQENFTGRINFMSMFNNISWGSKDNEKEYIANSTLVSVFAKRFSAGH